MYLGPHHFQSQARFFQDTLDFLLSCLWANPNGFLHLSLGAEAIRNGTVAVEMATGVMPDGTPFEISGTEAALLTRRISPTDFPDRGRFVPLYLALRTKQGGALIGDHPTSRWRRQDLAVADEITGAHESTVCVAQENYRLCFPRELDESLDLRLAVARLERDGKGQIAFDPEFVPTSLAMSAAPRLYREIQALTDEIEALAASLADRRKRTPGSASSSRALADFWLLHTLTQSLPGLKELLDNRHNHPMEVHRRMLRLAGALSTFSVEGNASTLPTYRHEDPGPGFFELQNYIRRHLHVLVPDNCISIPLERFDENYFRASISDERAFGRSRWLLGFHGNQSEEWMSRNVQAKITISAESWIKKAVARALKGPPVTYVPNPPSQIDGPLNVRYFSIDNRHEDFEAVERKKSIGVYVPSDIAIERLDLHIIVE
jgi:type VI secretion system protein ImpJ